MGGAEGPGQPGGRQRVPVHPPGWRHRVLLLEWSGLSSGQFPADASSVFQRTGMNLQRTAIFLTGTVKKPGNYKAAPAVKVDPLGPLSNPAVTLSTRSSISGLVWSDTTKGDRVVGPLNRDTGKGDVNLSGYSVYASVLTDEAQKRAIEIEKLLLNERAGDQGHDLGDARGGPRAERRHGHRQTDANGQCTLRAGYSALNSNSWMCMWVTEPQGNMINDYSPFPARLPDLRLQPWRGATPGLGHRPRHQPGPGELLQPRFRAHPVQSGPPGHHELRPVHQPRPPE